MKNNKNYMPKTKLKIAIIVSGISILLIIFWLTPVLGGIWIIGDVKPLPPRFLTQRLSDNKELEINEAFQHLVEVSANSSYLYSKSDVCTRGQNNAKVHDGYSNACTITVTHFFVGTDNFQHYVSQLTNQLESIGWNNTDKEGHTSEVNNLNYVMNNYYDKYIGTTKEPTPEYKEITGYDSTKYSLNDLPSATYWTPDKKRVKIEFGEIENNTNYRPIDFKYIQHPTNSIFTNYNDSSIKDNMSIVQGAIDSNGKFIIAIAITDTYFSN